MKLAVVGGFVGVPRGLTLTMGVMNSSRKVCLRRDGQLWWKKLISRPLMWEPS